MLKLLTRQSLILYHFVNSTKIIGLCSNLSGYCTGLSGDCSNLSGYCTGLSGDCSGLSGDCTGLSGYCTSLSGDLDMCEVSNEERKKGMKITELVKITNSITLDLD